ncbi:MAG: FAD-dependent oxidoreductase [Sphingopyxis sp.]
MTISRRSVVLGSAGAAAGAGALGWHMLGDDAPPATLGGADVARGHRLRDGRFPEPSRAEEVAIAIVGGGVAGLAAGWTLADAGFDDFALLELEDEAGGNARSGRNAVSQYPLGAHYLPVANREATALHHLLERLGMIVGKEADGTPRYDPYQLCADLQERVLWQGRWHEGLIPSTGLGPRDRDDLAAFHAAMEGFRHAVGRDGRPAFALPIAYSSADPRFTALDEQDFAHWIAAQGWRSPVLLGHVRYCCRDDYGCEPDQVSAWAGIHYFAGRRGWAAGDAGDNVLTWSEGNARLTRGMAAAFPAKIHGGRIVFTVRRDGGGVAIDSFDVTSGSSIRTRARAAILACPHFVAARIASASLGDAGGVSYAPWLVANITLDRPPAGRGAALAWDNVGFVGDSLGYVVASHQDRALGGGPMVVTWYLPLSRLDPAAARRQLLSRPASHWRDRVVADLLRTNPELDGAIRDVALWRWGHAMVRPTPGFITRTAPAARAAAKPPLFLAHSDMSGLSLFEEAHYRGVDAAEGAMRHLGHAHESRI